jgi:hypothetical protein
VQYHEYHEIQNNAHSLDHRLGIDWRAGLHSVKLSIKPFGVLAAGYSANALDIAGRILLLAAFLIESATVFLFSAIVMLSWIRSGTCFKRKPIVKRVAAEMGLGLASGLLVSGAVPGVTLVWALGVWLFFLIQALYFVLFEYQSDSHTKIEVDPFEKAKMAAEKILSGGAFY